MIPDVAREILGHCLTSNQSFVILRRVCKLWKTVADESFRLQSATRAFEDAINLNKVDGIRLLLTLSKRIDFDPDIHFHQAIWRGNAQIVRVFFESEQMNIGFGHLFNAAMSGHVNIFEMILDHPSTKSSLDATNLGSILKMVSSNKPKSEIVKIILKHPLSDQLLAMPTVMHDILMEAVVHRRSEALKVLLKDDRIDPSLDQNAVLRVLCHDGSFFALEICPILLFHSKVSPGDKHNEALSNAALCRNDKLVKMLLKDPRVDPEDRWGHNYLKSEYVRRMKAELKDEEEKVGRKEPQIDSPPLNPTAQTRCIIS
eukprot:TRINITY_DN8839_c0_g1_i1.p2 TRINITY_DN8839_c0_g1~~TRINITY_DN8839_c0_g1_i1.p2  ORF type:complete len:315 (+),score=39.68 TRINITY_DN8839_c0_g1_i1:1294-2238(+)